MRQWAVLLFIGVLSQTAVAVEGISSGEVFEKLRKVAESADDSTHVIVNAKLIRPSVDTQAEAQAKHRNKIFGHIVVSKGTIDEVIEGMPLGERQIQALKFRGLGLMNLMGKYLMPGMHDLHVHNYGMNADLPNSPIYDENGDRLEHLDNPGMEAMNYRMAYGGLTTHLDLNAFNRDLKVMRDEQRTANQDPGSVESPQSNIYMTGGIFTAETSHHSDLTWLVGGERHVGIEISRKDVLEEPDPELRYQKFYNIMKDHIEEFSPTGIKISYDHNPHRPGTKEIYNFDRTHLRDMIRSVREIQPDLKVICHVGVWMDLIECMEEGADAVTHLPYSYWRDKYYAIPDGIFEKMKEHDLTVIPTMTVYMEGGLAKSSLFDVTFEVKSCEPSDENCICDADVCTTRIESGMLNGNRHFFDDSLLNEVAPKRLLDSYFDFEQYRGNSWLQWGVDHNRMGYRLLTFKLLMGSGVRVLLGTDTMWEATFFGFSHHRELELMMLSNNTQKAPKRMITEMEALATTTSRVHEFLGHNRGQIQPGFAADLVAL
ncbi:MAG: hypothetical protein AAF202_08635, partial [Pseudomonadota bacterium]